MSLLSTAVHVLSDQTLLMPVIYISGLAMLLLAVLYASSPSRRQEVSSNALASPETVPGKLAGRNEIDASGAQVLRRENKQAEQDSAMEQRFRDVREELALLKSKIEGLEASGDGREKGGAAPTGANGGLAIADLRGELEAIRAEIGMEWGKDTTLAGGGDREGG